MLSSLRTLPRATSRHSPVHTVRAFSSSPVQRQKLRIGYIPEHFLTPLHLACTHYNLSSHAELIPFPSGTGTLIDAFQAQSIDVGIGLTEAWIVGLTKTPRGPDWSNKPYHLIGQYTTSPLTWAISTGAKREDLTSVSDLSGTKVGISRYGSGSHVMAAVLSQQQGWHQGIPAKANDFVECGPHPKLREAVNEGKADWYMWEHFTTKKFWDNGELKRLGELQTPWPAWHIVAAGANADERVATFLLPALAKGVKHFQDNRAEAIEWITSTMEYSKEDAEAWYQGVAFASRKEMGELDEVIMTNTVKVLEGAGAVGERKVLGCKDLAAVDAERYMQSASEAS